MGAVLACALLLAPGSAFAAAASFVVNTTNDAAADGCTTAANGCTLRDAITDANGNGNTEMDQISFSVTGDIALMSALPTITTPMTITGPGPRAADLTVAGNLMGSPQTIFRVNIASMREVVIEKIEIADARATTGAGGLLKLGTGSLTLDSVSLFDNDASQGGGLFLGEGFTSIRNSTLDRNQSETDGAGIVVTKSSVVPATAELVNSTISGSTAKQFGGAIKIDLSSSITIRSSTISDNTANSDNNATGDGGGIYNNASTVTIANTVLSGNTVGAGAGTNSQCGPISSPFTSQGHNLRSAADAGCVGFTGTGDVVNPAPMLGGLGANGGLTDTIPLLSGSPAINAGDPGPLGADLQVCPTTDQRGLPRGGLNGTCDIGAFEVQVPPPPPLAATTPPVAAFDLAAAIRKCKKKFPKGPKRKRCIKRAKRRAGI